MKHKPIKRRIERMREYLPTAIVGEAKTVNIEDVKPGARLAIQQVDDKVLIICDHDPEFYIRYIGSFFLGFSFLIFIFSWDREGSGIFIFILSSIGILSVLYGFTMPKKEIILDRENGLFTYPGFFWGKAITIPFEEAVVNIGTIGFPPGLTLNAFHPNGITSAVLSGYKQIETWNLFVWYMDKNRPLPPGTAFDPYRRKDYERRKAEGFPSPLYPSEIPTPDIFERSFRL